LVLAHLGRFAVLAVFPTESIEPVPEIVATYDYTDVGGALLYQVCRFQPKDFRQRRPDGNGGWIWNLNGVERVPYHLPAVARAAQAGEVVWIAEGEKDCDHLARLGLTATCNVGGAGRWRPEYAVHLRGSPLVVILPDNDPPGQRHAEQVAVSLHGIAASVKIVALPGLAPRSDVTDWLDAGHGVQELFAVVREAPAWAPSRAVTIARHRAAIKIWQQRLGKLRERAAAKRSRDHARIADEAAWRLRVDRAKAIPLTTIASALGLGPSEGRGRERVVRCPFHDDEHPSLALNDAKGLWYCGPCGQGGNAIGLYMRVRGVDFADAVLALTTGR
jgi:hypothetical protein